MSDTPKFEVIDRRKYKGEEEERESGRAELREPEAVPERVATTVAAPAEPVRGPQLVMSEPEPPEDEIDGFGGMPAPPTAEESREQKSAYDASAQRLEDLVRAQNPAAGPQPPVTFEQLVQQFYVSAMLQMGAGTQEGQRPRVDILGARQTIDLLGVLADKTKGNLTPVEDRMLQAVLYETRMAFLELTNMISMPGIPPVPPAAPVKR